MVEGDKMANHNAYAKNIDSWLIELLVESPGFHAGFTVSKLHYKQTISWLITLSH